MTSAPAHAGKRSWNAVPGRPRRLAIAVEPYVSTWTSNVPFSTSKFGHFDIVCCHKALQYS